MTDQPTRYYTLDQIVPTAPEGERAKDEPMPFTRDSVKRFDCYANAEADEPMFILLGRDAMAPELVRRWATMRERNGETAEKVEDARACALAMETWRAANRPAPRPAEPLEQAEREYLHDLLQRARSVIDPETNPEIDADILAVLTPCDAAVRCVRPAEPEPPKAEQEPHALAGICPDCDGTSVSKVHDGKCRVCVNGLVAYSQPKADTGTLEPVSNSYTLEAGTLEARIEKAIQEHERLDVNGRLNAKGWATAKYPDHGKAMDLTIRAREHGEEADLLRDALTELRRLRAEVVVTKHARVLSLLGRSSEQEAREEGLREKLAEAEIRAEQAEARAASPDLRALVEKIIAEMRNDAGHYGGRDGMILRGFVKKLEASLTGTGEQK